MSITIKGNIMWAQLEDVNDMSGKYQVDLCNLSDAAVDALEAMEIKVHYRDDQPDKGSYITTKSARPIRAYDSDGAVIDGKVVGNGSKFVAKISSYEWTFRNKSGVSPTLDRLVITELEMFDPDSDFGSEDLDEAL